MSLLRPRAAVLSHVQQTNSPYNWPEIGTNIAEKANRAGVAERFPDPAVQQRLDVALARLGYSDGLLTERERGMVNTAKEPNAQVCSRRRSIPGVGNILALVLLDEIHDIQRFPRVQECVSYGRLVTWAKASAGKRYGTSGPQMGHTSLTWAFSAAAVLCLRNTPAGQTDLARLENHQGQGNALTMLAPTSGRAVYDL
jgi:transposase